MSAILLFYIYQLRGELQYAMFARRNGHAIDIISPIISYYAGKNWHQ